MATRIRITRKDKTLNQEIFFQLLGEFIKDTSTGKRFKKNGARISQATVDTYINLSKIIHSFAEHSKFDLKFYVISNLTQREKEQASTYWRKFYKAFTDFMYDEKNYFDNYVGHNIKRLRVFFNYLNNERNINVGNFHKSFYVPKEDIDIITISPEQFNYIIFDDNFNELIEAQGLVEVKDIFVFGSTVALRVSDLLGLTRKNLIIQHGNYYLNVKSQKTKTKTSIKLPDYAIDIIKKYDGKQKTLLPTISRAYLDIQLKKVGKLLPDDYEVVKTREQRGNAVIIYKDPINKIHYKLSDHITTHTMRRTAITNMLNLGMPEYMVRKISGHAANSREFFKYVELMQSSMDRETEMFFQKIVESGMENATKKCAFLA
jgi:integrase